MDSDPTQDNAMADIAVLGRRSGADRREFSDRRRRRGHPFWARLETDDDDRRRQDRRDSPIGNWLQWLTPRRR